MRCEIIQIVCFEAIVYKESNGCFDLMLIMRFIVCNKSIVCIDLANDPQMIANSKGYNDLIVSACLKWYDIRCSNTGPCAVH